MAENEKNLPTISEFTDYLDEAFSEVFNKINTFLINN